MKISIFWTWYVGLVTWTCFAEIWFEVLCVDIDEEKIKKLEEWIIPIYEPWLEEMVVRNFKNWRLKFTTDAKKWVNFWKYIFSAVWTPPDENHRADLKFVKKVAETFGKYADDYKVFINKSTIPVWTWEICKEIIKKELEKRWSNLDFDVVSNPEFLREWCAVRDFMLPDRIVCWVENEKAKAAMEALYKPLTRNYSNIIFTDIKSSEIIKYASNAFLATKISFINEIANFVELAWWDVKQVAKGLWSDKRIWDKFLHAWIWYWWSCFPKDVDALIETWKDFWYDFNIIKSVQEVNDKQKTILVDKIEEKVTLEGKKIAIWGLSFKPKTDDTREAPSIEIIKKLIDKKVANIKAFDPIVKEEFLNNVDDKKHIKIEKDKYSCLENADILMILTEWDEFRWADLEIIQEKMSWNMIFDGRNIWNKDDFKNKNLIYESIWRP